MKTRIRTFRDHVGELTAVYRRTALPTVQIHSSQELYEWLYPHFEFIMDDHEQAKIVHLNRSNHIVNLHHVSSGSDVGTIIPIKSILRNALLIQTSSIILAHNHPSGNLQPSAADIKISRKLKKAAQYLELKLLDSIILTREGYYSLADQGDI